MAKSVTSVSAYAGVIKSLFRMPRFYSRALSMGSGLLAFLCLMIAGETLFELAKPIDSARVGLAVIASLFTAFASYAFWTQRTWALKVTTVVLFASGYWIPALGFLLSLRILECYVRDMVARRKMDDDVERIAQTLGINWTPQWFWTVNELVLTGDRQTAIKSYRDARGVTWDQAGLAIRQWNLGAEKLRFVVDFLAKQNGVGEAKRGRDSLIPPPGEHFTP